MGIIYKIVNDINDKVYIGQTIKSMNRRWTSHLVSAKSSPSLIYRAMRKYGIEHFHPEIIEECSTDMLDEREQYWIKEYNSFGADGYNSTYGGKSYHRHDPEEIMRLWDEGYNVTSIGKMVNADIHTVCYILEGYSPYIENKEQRRYESMQDKKYEERPVKQYTWQGEFVKEYESLAKAAQAMNIDKGTIWCACRGKYNFGAGYQWRYSDDDRPVEEVESRGRITLQCDSSGQVIKRYRSITEASRLTGFSYGMLKRALKSKKIYKGYYWKFGKETT